MKEELIAVMLSKTDADKWANDPFVAAAGSLRSRLTEACKAALPQPIVWHDTPIGVRVAQVGDRRAVDMGDDNCSVVLVSRARPEAQWTKAKYWETPASAEAWLRGAE